MSKLYRISWHSFHGGSDYVDGSLARLKPVIKHLVKNGTPYRITDENGKIVRNVKPTAGGKIRGQFRKPKRLSNPARGPRGEVDQIAGRELELYMENESTLYPQKLAIVKNLSRKMAKGQYDPAKAAKLWLYWVESGARMYAKEIAGEPNFAMIFNVPTRQWVAKRIEAHERGRIERREYENSPRESNPGSRSVHTAKFDRCVESVKRSGSPVNPYAVCTAQLGERGSVKVGHRRRNPLPSDREIDSDVTLTGLDKALSLMSYLREPREREHYDQTIGKHVIAAFRAWKTRSFNRLAHAALTEAQAVIRSSQQWIAGTNQHVIAEKAIAKGLAALSLHRSKNPVRDPEHKKLLKELGQHFSSDEAALRRMRKGNPLPSVRKIYYIVCASKGSEHFYLKRSGKLTRRQADAARFATTAEAVAKAKAHLAQYPASRSFRFDVKIAY